MEKFNVKFKTLNNQPYVHNGHEMDMHVYCMCQMPQTNSRNIVSLEVELLLHL